MSPRHLVRKATYASWGLPPALEGHAKGFRRWTVVDEGGGAVHTGFGIGEMEPDGRLEWHVHSYEESLYVLEGRGYDLHQDCDVEITDTYHWKPQDEIKRYEWEAGDVIYIPPNTIHQHFNASADKPVRLISATNRIYKACGLNDLEQVENAPEYDPNVVLTAELIEQYLRVRSKVPA